ncbi:hypothetical protein QDY71_09870 [Kingella negevensis]|uniref:Uncharacterized protein n=1 Tax=Kingella negevensis TaxID=1522312 RepID=A0A238TBQ1_9NEIS|nr:hypothetical protein [Kingella negevensis]MDK4680902.1 hypothetical protein [Kingella negevensis]MDK4683104.1 hypothetical protein [Kingella negevensis]MDK4684013.1 hypothetical protein [Kingella negevensis]MDK4691763.1 hypothetical protein [Kingella negevensis]MDK4693084.1 hypothetical protein [Kingella negevensis]
MEQLNQQLAELAQQARLEIDSGQFKEAEQTILKVLALVPNHIVALADLALVECRLGKKESAYTHIQQALTQCYEKNDDIELHLYAYGTGIEACLNTNRYEEARWLARRAVQYRKQLVEQHGNSPLPITQPAPPLSDNREENIISYSLFGDKPRYNEVSVMNAKIAREIYPEWTCRFYVNDTVPKNTITRLQAQGAQIVDMTGSPIHGLFWRFLVAADTSVKRFIIRDADSLLSNKERAAVQEWLDSGKHFHVMRDALLHDELILAGMWGGCGGVFHDMEQRILTSSARFRDRTIDQQFLRYAAWNTVKQSVFSHDTWQLDPDSRAFPSNYILSDVEREPHFHIGMIDAAKPTEVHISDENAKRVRWFVVDEADNIVCHYESDVPDNKIIRVILPNQYTRDIDQQKWRILTQTIAA